MVSIGAGNEHSLFVTQEGKLYTAGYNDNGQCGMGSNQQVRYPTAVPALEGEEIAQVHVYNGCEHSLAVTRDGKIFSFGYNYRGQVRAICSYYRKIFLHFSLLFHDFTFVMNSWVLVIQRVNRYLGLYVDCYLAK